MLPCRDIVFLASLYIAESFVAVIESGSSNTRAVAKQVTVLSAVHSVLMETCIIASQSLSRALDLIV